MKDREKEIQHLLYLQAELIKQAKKEIKKLNSELEDIRGQKRLTKNNKGGHNNARNNSNHNRRV